MIDVISLMYVTVVTAHRGVNQATPYATESRQVHSVPASHRLHVERCDTDPYADVQSCLLVDL